MSWWDSVKDSVSDVVEVAVDTAGDVLVWVGEQKTALQQSGYDAGVAIRAEAEKVLAEVERYRELARVDTPEDVLKVALDESEAAIREAEILRQSAADSISIIDERGSALGGFSARFADEINILFRKPEDVLLALANPDRDLREAQLRQSTADISDVAFKIAGSAADFVEKPPVALGDDFNWWTNPSSLVVSAGNEVYKLLYGRYPTNEDMGRVLSSPYNFLPINLLSKLLYGVSVHAGESAELSLADYGEIALMVIPLPAASLGKIGAKISTKSLGRLIPSVVKKAPKSSWSKILNPLKKGWLDSQMDYMVAVSKAVAPKGMEAVSTTIHPITKEVLGVVVKPTSSALGLFLKSVQKGLEGKFLPIVLLVISADVLAWGFGLGPEQQRDKFHKLNNQLIEIYKTVRSAMIDGDYVLAKKELDLASKVISELEAFFGGITPRFYEMLGWDFGDLDAIIEAHREHTKNLLDALPPVEELEAPLPYVLKGPVLSVHDGDTFKMRHDDTEQSVRLYGVMAPEVDVGTEISLFAGRVMREQLRELILDKEVEVKPTEEKFVITYDRVLGNVTVEGQSVGYQMRQSKPSPIKIRSSPTTAEVFLTGTTEFSDESIADLFVGFTGTVLRTIPPGNYHVKLKKFGYFDKIISITVPAGSDKVVEIPGVHILEEEPDPDKEDEEVKIEGMLSVSTEPEVNAYVYLNDNYTGKKTPALITWGVGSYVVKCLKKGHSFISADVEIKKGETSSVILPSEEVEEDEETESRTDISFSTIPEGAYIYLDGIYTGKKTPRVFLLEAGSHEAIFEKEGFISAKHSFNVVEAEPKALKYPLEEIPKEFLPVILIESDPKGADIYIDGLPTGKRTPKYFEIEKGPHFVRVEKTGFEPAEAEFTIGE